MGGPNSRSAGMDDSQKAWSNTNSLAVSYLPNPMLTILLSGLMCSCAL